MASASAETLILFIASVAIAASLAGVTITQTNTVMDAIEDRSLDQSQQLKTEIQIVTDPNGPIYDREDNGNITLHIKNSGKQRLSTDPGMRDVLVNGSYVSTVTVTPLEGTTWDRNDVVRIEISTPGLSSGDHRVKIIIGEEAEIFRFRT